MVVALVEFTSGAKQQKFLKEQDRLRESGLTFLEPKSLYLLQTSRSPRGGFLLLACARTCDSGGRVIFFSFFPEITINKQDVKPKPVSWLQANWLKSMGVRKGDAVAIYMPMVSLSPATFTKSIGALYISAAHQLLSPCCRAIAMPVAPPGVSCSFVGRECKLHQA